MTLDDVITSFSVLTEWSDSLRRRSRAKQRYKLEKEKNQNEEIFLIRSQSADQTTIPQMVPNRDAEMMRLVRVR